MAKNSAYHFDLIIIGAGPAGIAAALRAQEIGLKTLLVNAGLPIGGTCLHAGCIPWNKLVYVAQSIYDAHKGLPGVQFSVDHFDFKAVMSDLKNVVDRWQAQDEKVIENLWHISYKKGWARFLTPFSICVGSQVYSADTFIIAAGGKVAVPPIPGLVATGFLTHATILELKRIPQSLLVVGGGSFGIECAQIFSRFGTHVTVIEESNSLFKRGDKELVGILESLLEKEGVLFYKNIKLKQAFTYKGLKRILGMSRGMPYEFEAQEIVIASGKRPLSAGLGLDAACVAVDCSGAVIVNDFLQTSQKHIFAVGDIAQLPMRIETTAAQEGRMAVDNAYSGTRYSIDYASVPYSLSTDPPLSYIGVGQEDRNHYSISVPLSFVSYAHIIEHTQGMVKMFVHRGTERICGMHMLGRGSKEIISHVASLMHADSTLYDMDDSIFAFPSYAQIFKILASQRKVKR